MPERSPSATSSRTSRLPLALVSSRRQAPRSSRSTIASRFASRLLEQLREAAGLEQPAAGLAVGAVEDRVLLEIHLGDRRSADVAGLAELAVDTVDAVVLRSPFP